jgi:hypothetical protein
MNKLDIVDLLRYIIICTLCVGVAGFIIDRERTLAYAIGHAIFLGIILGSMFYFFDKKKTKTP